MSPVILWGVAATVTGLGVTLVAAGADRRALLYIAKPAASVGFIVVALGSGGLDNSYGWWILVGLGLSLLGDVLLMFRGWAPFRIGLVSFLLAHVAYAVAFLDAGISVPWWLGAGVVALLAALVVTRWLLPHIESDMRAPVLAYVVVISGMVSLAVGVSGAGRSLLVGAGAGLFYLSDLFVARDRFVTPSLANTLVGLPLYYGGQILLALSVGV